MQTVVDWQFVSAGNINIGNNVLKRAKRFNRKNGRGMLWVPWAISGVQILLLGKTLGIFITNLKFKGIRFNNLIMTANLFPLKVFGTHFFSIKSTKCVLTVLFLPLILSLIPLNAVRMWVKSW